MVALVHDRAREVVQVDIAGDPVEHVNDLRRATVRETESVDEFGQYSPVVKDLCQLVVHDGEIEAVQSIKRRSVVVGHKQRPLERTLAHGGIGGGFDEQRDRGTCLGGG